MKTAYCGLCLVVCLVVSTLGSDESSAQADDNRTVDPQAAAKKYLEQFNYMKKPNPGSPASITDGNSMSDPLKNFQRFANIPQTGELDAATRAMMKVPRCGNPDMPDEVVSKTRKRRYVREGSRWRSTSLTYRISQYTPDLGRTETQREIQRCFDIWAEVTPLTFRRVDSGRADIDMKFVYGSHGDGSSFDGRGNTLAHAFFPRFGGDVHMDEAEPWTINMNTGINLFQVVSHEIGHSLGLSHSDVRDSLMAPFYRRFVPGFRLHSDDIAGIQSLYGRAPIKAPTVRPTTTTTRRRTVVNRRITTPTTTTTTRRTPPQSGFDACKTGVDAITTMDDGEQYVFMGDFYLRLTRKGIAPGYPKLIRQQWPSLQTPVDAAVTIAGYIDWSRFAIVPGYVLFFKGSQVWKYVKDRLQTGYPRSISSLFRGLPNDIDSAFVWSGNTKKIYFTKGTKYYRYTSGTSIDSNYPRSLKAWRGLPSSVDAVFMDLNYRTTYFFKDDKYYRFDDRNFKVYSYYPRSISQWWLGCMGALAEGSEGETDLREAGGEDGLTQETFSEGQAPTTTTVSALGGESQGDSGTVSTHSALRVVVVSLLAVVAAGLLH